MSELDGTHSPHRSPHHHFRFHVPHAHLSSAFGDGRFGGKAERFARFFGTPTFLVGQTIIVGVWIGLTSSASRTSTSTRSSCSISPSACRRRTPRR